MWKTYQNQETGAWYCFKCGARGAGEPTIKQVDPGSIILDIHAEPQWAEVVLPPFEALSRMGRGYLTDRGVQDPGRFHIVELQGKPRLLFPYFNNGDIIYWSTRAYSNDGQPKYMTAPGRHPLYVVPGSFPAVVVEGVLDAIVVAERTGNKTIALGGKTVPRYLRHRLLVEAGRGARAMLDGDAVEYTLRLVSLLPEAKPILLPPGADPADFFKDKEVGCSLD